MPGTRVSAWKTLSAPTTRVRTIIAAAMVCGPAVTRHPRGALRLQRRRGCLVERHVRSSCAGGAPPPRGPPRGAAPPLPISQVVLGVERKGVAEDRCRRGCRAAGRRVDVLFEVTADAIGDAVQADARITDGDAADLRRGRRVAFDQRRRYTEHVGVVVEPGRGVIRRKHRADVDVHREQVANRIRILGTIQSMKRRRARVGMRQRHAIELPLECA